MTGEKKNIRDYLHLYLGCMHQWRDEDGEWRHPSTLTSYQLNEVLRHHIEARPILRRLSDMTDDEVKELFHYNKISKEYKGISFDRHMANGVLTGITMNYLVPTDDGDHYQGWTLEFSGMNAYVFKWLLSKGFDLFGLINEGLALPQPPKQ